MTSELAVIWSWSNLEKLKNSSCPSLLHAGRRSWRTSDWYSRVTGGRTRSLIHGLTKQAQHYMSFIALLSQNRSFQTLQSCQFRALLVVELFNKVTPGMHSFVTTCLKLMQDGFQQRACRGGGERGAGPGHPSPGGHPMSEICKNWNAVTRWFFLL